MIRTFLIIILCVFSSSALAEEAVVKRQLIAFYDSKEESTVRFGLTHRFLEMPANHLGYNIQYHDINAPLPNLTEQDDIHGIILWFYGDMAIPDAPALFDWLLDAQAKKKKIVLVGDFGFKPGQLEEPGVTEKYHAFMQGMGIRDSLDWNELTYEAKIIARNDELLGFERDYNANLPPFRSTHAMDTSISHLKISPGKGAQPADLIITSDAGGYVAGGYFMFIHEVKEGSIVPDEEEYEIIKWYINPFEFLRIALSPSLAPVPDVTTLNGRRIFYSHIDGDGWNSLSEVPKYNNKKVIAARVMMNEVLIPYADIPFTVGAITSELDTQCYGLPDSKVVAKEIYALPNVEPASHTHSHPLFWQFFDHYHPENEKPFLDKYPPQPKYTTSLFSAASGLFDKAEENNTPHQHAYPQDKRAAGRTDPTVEGAMKDKYDTPRSYACQPFDLNQELQGSIDTVNALSPEDKKAVLVQWSGNTSPYEEVLAETREAGLLNINGGDSRFDREYPSYAWVSPIGVQIGNERQIYSSNSNENTYTNLWTDRFFGFRFLKSTVENTENPIRVSAFNIYFHMYSAEKYAALNALIENLEYARSQPIIPIKTSDYARIANGFYSTELISVGQLSWKVKNRGAMQTLRMDNATQYAVDLGKSEGVLGYKYYQNNLYISLDPATSEPVISLKNTYNNSKPYSTPYLMESTWPIKGLQKDKNSLTFTASGYGNGLMWWQVTPGTTYNISVTRDKEMLFTSAATADKEGVLRIHFKKVNAIKPVNVTLNK